ncbi:MAG: hypothetical protein ABSC88_07315 [Terracidiphilus sp.]|jgi:hypothetical protein
MLEFKGGVAVVDANRSLALHQGKDPGLLIGLCGISILAIGVWCQVAIGQQTNDTSRADVEKLQKVLGEADSVAVYSMNGFNIDRKLYSSGNPADLATLKSSVNFEEPVQWLQSACLPSTIIRLLRKNTMTGELGLICGDIARFSQWSSDAQITNPEPLFEWLDSRGITTPRKEFERERALEEKSRADEERWLKAMPSSIVQLWPSVRPDVLYKYDTRLLEEAISKEFPDTRARILRLMAWYGSGAGPWSGFPVYEVVPEQMLLEYSTPELVEAVAGANLSEQEIEGAARLFGGWEFNKSRPKDNALLPADIKRVLLEHSLKSTDEDKLTRARRAFATANSKRNP